jgi:phosphate starvation-inducible protein PhoH
MSILRKMNGFSSVEFDYDDIVRSGLVKEYIMAKDEVNDFQTCKTA